MSAVILPEQITCPDWGTGGHDLNPVALERVGFVHHNRAVAAAAFSGFTVEIDQCGLSTTHNGIQAHWGPPTIDVQVAGDGAELTPQQAAALAAALTEAVRLVERTGDG